MKTMLAGLALLMLAGCNPSAPTASTQPVPAAAATVAAAPATEPAPPASSDPLAWMEGRWCGKDEDQLIEETWLPPRQGESIGMSRTIAGDRMISFEFMRIADIEGKVALMAQPNGEPPVSFARTDGGADWIRFENKQHDYPQRIEYRKAGAGLHAEIGGPGEPGKEEVIAYEYTRCD